MVDRIRSSRRTVLQTLASLCATTIAATATVGARATDTERSVTVERNSHVDSGELPEPDGAYVAVVDRIVDGEHVVLLLERDGELVNQLVVSRSAFDTVEETDIMLVVIDEGELCWYLHIPERPPEGIGGADVDVDEMQSASVDGSDAGHSRSR
ncbi:hypothetical protein [Natronorubrum halalkaliphilum]|uniref:hypothetical protein n=1 Tax=Natronorubrum halalkaliphilum TaxID=2691917 RepID=UPI001F2313B3|nr:hypothetical protein [Natronorubrum halalkaliphilum]